MFVKQDISHYNHPMVFGKDFNTKEGIEFFVQALGKFPESVQDEMKRLIHYNNVIIDSTAEVEEAVITIDTNIGTVMMFNLYWLALAITKKLSDEEINLEFMRFFTNGLWEEKLNALETEGRVVFNNDNEDDISVMIDGVSYKPTETFNPLNSILGDEINTYIFEKFVKCGVVECLVDKEKVLKAFLNKMNNTSGEVH